MGLRPWLSKRAGCAAQPIGTTQGAAKIIVVEGPFGGVAGAIGAEFEILVFAEARVIVANEPLDRHNPPAVGNNFDATATQTIDLQALIQTASISSLQLHNFIVDSLN